MLAALVVLAAAKSSTKTSSSGDYVLLFIVAAFAVMYLLVIRPRNQRMRQARDQTQKAAVGDTIVTIGGLVGTIVAEDGDRVTLSTGSGTELVFLRQAIGRKLDATPTAPPVSSGGEFDGPPPGFGPSTDTEGEVDHTEHPPS